jgi:glycosyltransferase involved in cell wall biosynthesis
VTAPEGSPPEVSVVIATRNRRVWLAETMERVAAQRGVGWELLVVDDASTDDTWSFLQAQGMPGLRCFRQRTHGERSAARNLGLAEARGGSVMFLDDDDLLRPGALAVLQAALAAHPEAVAAVGARWDRFCEEDYERRDAHPRRSRTRNVFDELLFGWSAVSGQNLYRTGVVRDVGGYDVARIPCEDRDLWLRLVRRGPVVLCPEIVLTYRIHAGQWRPDDLPRIRELVARRAILALPPPARRRALLIRRSTSFFDRAQAAMGEGRFAAGLGLAARAVFAAPLLFTSPLIAPLVARRLAGRAWHRLRGR